MALKYDNKAFRSGKELASYIADTYPDEIEARVLEYMNEHYGERKPFIYNQKLGLMFVNHPELALKHRKQSSKKVRKSLGGRILTNVKEACDIIVKEAKEKNEEHKIPNIVATIFDDDTSQFATKFAHIRYKKKLIEYLRKEDIPEDIKKQLKLTPEDSKLYGNYQNNRQREYMAKKKAAQATEQKVSQD